MTITDPAVAANAHLDRILERVEDGLEKDVIPAEIFNDEAVFKAEMDQIFGTCWVFVAHESEIPNAGDFVQRRIGVDPVIVTRDGQGGVNVLSNYCRHRGTQVCQTDTGNSRFFKCPYHGWTFSNTGDLVGTPNMAGAYGERLDPKAWGLYRAPRVEIRFGLIFASLAAEGPSLEEYLGGAGWMLQMMLDLHPDGMRVAGPPERYKVKCNWKTGAENFAGDAYHVGTLHLSNEQIGVAQGLKSNVEVTRLYDYGSGHYSVNMPFTEYAAPEFVMWGYDPESVSKFDLTGLDDTQRHIVTHEPPIVGTIFPNFSFLRGPIAMDADGHDGEMTVVTTFRQWQPIGPGEMELWNWQFVWKFQDEKDALDAYVVGQFTFGSAGTFEVDDTVAWEGAPRAAKSPWMLREGMNFNFEQAHRSTVNHDPDPSYQGPGIKRGTGYGEHNQLSFYRHWLNTLRHGVQATTRQEG